MYSSALTECVMPSERKLSEPTDYQRTVRLKVRAPQMRMGERLAIVGSPESLGAWDTQKAVPMNQHECHEWVVTLDASLLPADRFEFKFVILDTEPDYTPLWEDGANRSIELPNMECGDVVGFGEPFGA